MHEYVEWALLNGVLFTSLYLVGHMIEKITWHIIQNWDYYQTKFFKVEI